MGILNRFRRHEQPDADDAVAEPTTGGHDSIEADRPIVDAEQDDLGRGALAKAIAADLIGSRGEIVAAINGPWGRGKVEKQPTA